MDELFGRLAEKPFDEFSEGERTLWQKLKLAVRRMLDRFLGGMRLPKWFELGDGELRYILWRSKKRLERGREGVVEMAQDMVKRREWGLDGEDTALYKMGDKPDTFEARQRRAVDNKGVVMPGLNNAEVKVVDDIPRHPYTGGIAQATQQAIDAANAKYVPNGKPKPLHYNNHGASFDYLISTNAIGVLLSAKHQAASVNKGVHLALAVHIDRVIAESIEVEEHPDRIKKDGVRDNDTINPNALMHRFYGVARIDGKDYRVMTLMKEDSRSGESNGVHSYEVQTIEVLNEKSPSTSNGVGTPNSELEAYPLAKVIDNVVKTMEPGKKLLEESKLADDDTALYRERTESDDLKDIMSDGSMGLSERITAAKLMLSEKHKESREMRDAARREVARNLRELQAAMGAQREFDRVTVKRVSDLARVLMGSGYLTGMTQSEVKGLLTAVKSSVGRGDIAANVDKVMDIMVDNQLRHAKEALSSLEKLKGSKVDARGVEVMGRLDAKGQSVLDAFKGARRLEKESIQGAIDSAYERIGSNDPVVSEQAALELEGLELAMRFAETVRASMEDEQSLRDNLKEEYDKAGEEGRRTESYKEFVKSVEAGLRECKIERLEGYYEVVEGLSGRMRESIAGAKALRDADKERVREIHHNANSDMEGRASNEHYKLSLTGRLVNNDFASFILSPLGTFDQMLRLFGNKSMNGEGYLYNRYMRGWVDARNKEISGVRGKFAELDKKAESLFGVKSWGGLIRMVGKLPKASVTLKNGGKMDEMKMTQGQLMYIYMVNKMLDGQMKLRAMGISEADVAAIERAIDPRLIDLADWLQEEFLPAARQEYNETHKRMFGAPMASIENYFPLRILRNARTEKEEDLDNPDRNDGITTKTGSIIKRRRNALALDLLNADALNVILDHIAQMEHWNAFAEYNRDLNTLRTYKRFRNQVENMTTVYGSGKVLWERFNDVCQLATGAYRPKQARFDKAAVNFAKGVSAAKVSFRLYTALKQLSSLPAFLPEVRVDHLAKSMLMPGKAWTWCMENLPMFEERWLSRKSGDPRLLKSEMDWKLWRRHIVDLASRVGMTPNAFVDAVTVSIGAYSIYKTRLGQYLRDGYEREVAEKRAKQDATVLFNETQQSSEGAFLSTIQTDKSWISVLFSIFRNASMGYQRQLHDALRNIRRNCTPTRMRRNVEFVTKQYVRDGLSEDAARSAAWRKLSRQMVKDGLRVATFGYLVQFAWNLMSYIPYMVLGGDDDEKEKMWDDVFVHSMFGGIEGLAGGDVASSGLNAWASGEVSASVFNKDMPLTQDLEAIGILFGRGEWESAVSDIVNLVVQSGVGVNPKTITDGVVAIMDACGDDPALAHEASICVARILNVPQSQLDKMYFDEVGLRGDEVSHYTPEELAARYARYQVKRGRFPVFWEWDDAGALKKKEARGMSLIKERLGGLSGEEVNEAYDAYAKRSKEFGERVKAAEDMAKKDYVKAAAMYQVLKKDVEGLRIYKMFQGGKGQRGLNSYFEELVDLYMNARNVEEAGILRDAVLDYKAGMVRIMGATDERKAAEELAVLESKMRVFEKAYGKAHAGFVEEQRRAKKFVEESGMLEW